MIGGFILGIIIRILIAFLGGQRLEALLSAIIVISDIGSGFTLGFFSSFIGLRALSLPGEIFQPVNVESYHSEGIIKDFIKQGFGPVLIRQWAAMDTLISIVILGVGIIILPAMWSYASPAIFNKIGLAITPLIMGIIWIGSLIRMDNHPQRIKYTIGLIIVGAFGILIINLDLGTFAVLIALNLMFMGFEGLSLKRLPDQHWNKELGWNTWSFDMFSLTCGILSGIAIGTPSSSLVDVFQGKETEQRKLRNHLAANIISNNVSLLLWFYFGSTRSAIGQNLDISGISLIGDFGTSLGFIIVIATLMTVATSLISDWSKLFFGIIKYVIPVKLLGIFVIIINLILMIGLGLNYNTLFLLLGLSLIIRGIFQVANVPKQTSIGMVSIIPIWGIWIKPLFLI